MESGFFPVRDHYLGQTFGGEFLLEQQIGSGGMGTVYRAVQAVTERQVAVKVVHRHLLSENVVRRFQQEAQIISKLNHPHIVTVFKYGQHTDGTLYIAMELAEGRDLAWLIQARALLDLHRSVPIMLQLADAVGYAHDLKIIHRDLKPENIVVARTGRHERVKILDFGIAKIIDTKYIVTKTGMLCGSPPCMAPEQWQQARDLDGRTDIYALGCVFYAMLTGRLPFEADSTPGYMTLHLEGHPVPPIERSEAIEAAPALNDIVLRCMARDRADRYPDAYGLVEALNEIQRTLENEPAKSDRLSPESIALPSTPMDSPGFPQADLPGRSPNAETRGYEERGQHGRNPSPDAEPLGSTSPKSLAATLPGDTPVTPLGEHPVTMTSGHGAEKIGSLQWTRLTLLNTQEQAQARKVHRALVLVGLLMLCFLALSFAYFVWWQRPSEPEEAAPTSSHDGTSVAMPRSSGADPLSRPDAPDTRPIFHRSAMKRAVP